MNFTKALSLSVLLLPLSILSCKKFIEVDLPIDKSTSESVYDKVGTTVPALNAIYITLSNEGGLLYGRTGITIRSGLLSDELTGSNLYYSNNLTGQRIGDEDVSMWDTMYRLIIYRVNSAINGISTSTGLQGQTKAALLAEAKFLRAFSYFYMVNYYGEVPLVLGTDFKENSDIPRSSVSKVYDQIIADLLDAKKGLSDNYITQNMSGISTERIRANKAVATAMLARVYLYLGKWQEAENNSSTIIADSRFRILDDLNAVFLKNSEETIWALQPNPLADNGRKNNPNTPDGKEYLPLNPPSMTYLSQDQIDAFQFNDQRLTNWMTAGENDLGDQVKIPYKYKKGEGAGQPAQEEYTMVLRLAEQYLIRAEARAKLGNLDGALSDLNRIRLRAGLTEFSSLNQVDILDAIELERQRELFSEGHRWLDLKRTGKIDQVMVLAALKKNASWVPYKALLPIPWSEFKLNPSLRGHQNIGYSEQ